MQKSQVAQSLLYSIDNLSTEEFSAIDANKEVLISSQRFMDICSEVVIPKHLIRKADKSYTYNTGTNATFSLLCDVLIHYLAEKNQLEFANGTPLFEVFKFGHNRKALPLQFYDFFVAEQAYLFTANYLDDTNEYYYEYDGLVNLSSKVAIYLFKNLIKNPENSYHVIGSAINQNPGGFYKFKEGTDVIHFIQSEISCTQGIFESDGDDFDDDDD